ncbi:MAG: hypothetical protein HY913_02500 [Desulfomonile tiedjei]|nr:hypothetical protein [Desulfomonile tiedjei]
MRAKEGYIKSLAKMKRDLYADGRKIDRTDEWQMNCRVAREPIFFACAFAFDWGRKKL